MLWSVLSSYILVLSGGAAAVALPELDSFPVASSDIAANHRNYTGPSHESVPDIVDILFPLLHTN